MHRRGDVHVCCHDSLRDLAHFSQPNILLAIPLSVLQTHCTIAFTHTPKNKFSPAGCNTPLCNPSTQQYCFSRESQLCSCSFTSLFSNGDVSQSISHTSRAQGFHSCKSTHNSNYTCETVILVCATRRKKLYYLSEGWISKAVDG
jgi:hypothetical protein